jgi:hypothetical protein
MKMFLTVCDFSTPVLEYKDGTWVFSFNKPLFISFVYDSSFYFLGCWKIVAMLKIKAWLTFPPLINIPLDGQNLVLIDI